MVCCLTVIFSPSEQILSIASNLIQSMKLQKNRWRENGRSILEVCILKASLLQFNSELSSLRKKLQYSKKNSV